MISQQREIFGVGFGTGFFKWRDEWQKSEHGGGVFKRFKVLEFSTNPGKIPGRRILHLQVYILNIGMAFWCSWKTAKQPQCKMKSSANITPADYTDRYKHLFDNWITNTHGN